MTGIVMGLDRTVSLAFRLEVAGARPRVLSGGEGDSIPRCG
jgi:hypothetical protein